MAQAIPRELTPVLIVDDDEQILELTAEVVRRLGYWPITARNGFEALDSLRKHPEIRVLFSDIRMPGMDGEQLADAALSLQPKLRIILTSGTRPPRRAVDFVPKPYRAADLIRALPPQPLRH
ncbi:MAG: response regulator [Alphaproteobacteria bacterium]|nr:response regulator [Alphaproteobacteria bacterium]